MCFGCINHDGFIGTKGKLLLFDLDIRTIHADEKSAELELSVEVRSADSSCPVLQYTIEDGETEVLEGESQVSQGTDTITLNMASPRLWYPLPAGEPFLYELKTRLLEGVEEVDRKDIRFGIRTVELKQDGEFTVAVNGRRVFARGANWVPSESLSLVATPEKYDYLLSLAKDAEFNMLRVWGGGIYEPEAFYDLCDRHGIMVWQDFTYSCGHYPDDDAEFVREAEREAKLIVRRLRNRPSLVLWCGNNENEELHYSARQAGLVDHFYGAEIYHRVLPRVCADLDPTRPYWPSSSYGGVDPNSPRLGDRHTGVRYEPGSDGYRGYAKDSTKFVSEFYAMSANLRQGLERFLPAE